MSNKKILIWLAFFFIAYINPVHSEKIIKPPIKIYYDSKNYTYNNAWKDTEAYIETNLDDDPEKEIILSFMGTFKPKKDRDIEKSQQTYYMHRKNEITIVQNIAFYQIYDKKPSGYYEIKKTLTGTDMLGKILLISEKTGAPPAIAIISPAGEHSISLEILQWKHDGYNTIFSEMTRINGDINSIKNNLIFGSKYIWDPVNNTLNNIEN